MNAGPDSPPQGAATPTGQVPLVAPGAVRLVDLDAPPDDLVLHPSRTGMAYRCVMLIGRLDGHPVASATLPVRQDGRIPGAEQARALRDALGTTAPLPHAVRSTDRRSISVVIITCRNPRRLERCMSSIVASSPGDIEIVVVENRPGGGETERLLGHRFAGHPGLRYVEEPRPGQSWARNAGLAHASGEIVVFADDDVVVEPHWLARLMDGFGRGEDVACVTGLILPLELETPSQVLLEQFATFGKGLRPRTHRLLSGRAEDPLFPYTAGTLGSGANTAVRADVARRLGGFDTNLGAGSRAFGGEDLDLFIRLLLDGWALSYEPAAIVWHEHPDGLRRLRRQVFQYGVGLTAMLTKHLLRGPERGRLLRQAPAGVRYVLDPGSRKNAGKPGDYPRRLALLERAGMVVGPAAYVAGAAGARPGRAVVRSESA